MGQGQGSVIVNQRKEPVPPPGPPGPPFLLTSADNGLSVDPISKRIVLGQSLGAVGNPAGLLDNREIPFNGFTLDYIDLGVPNQIRFDPSLPEIRLINFASFANGHLREFELFFNNANGNINLDAAGPGPTLTLQGTLAGQDPRIIWDFGLADQYKADWDGLVTGNFILGDANNLVQLILNDTTFQSRLFATDGTGFAQVRLNGDIGGGNLFASLNATDTVNGALLELDPLNKLSHLQANDVANQTDFVLKADGAGFNVNAQILINTTPRMVIDAIAGVYQFGDIVNSQLLEIDTLIWNGQINVTDFTGTANLTLNANTGGAIVNAAIVASDGVNSTRFLIDTMAQVTDIKFDAAAYFQLDFFNRVFSLGDISGVANDSKLTIDDTNINAVLQAGIIPTFVNVDGLNTVIFLQTGGVNTATMSLNDTANKLFIANAANTLGININGSDGFTGTLAAAIAGGKSVVSGLIVN